MITNISKQEERRLIFLCSQHYWHFENFNLDEEILKAKKDVEFFKNKNASKEFWDNKLELFLLLKKKGFEIDKEARLFWFKTNLEYRKISSEYSKKPTRVRKDNKDFINFGSANSNGNKIRYPKKCRKTAWKRFYRLFPNLKPEEKTIL